MLLQYEAIITLVSAGVKNIRESEINRGCPFKHIQLCIIFWLTPRTKRTGQNPTNLAGPQVDYGGGCSLFTLSHGPSKA